METKLYDPIPKQTEKMDYLDLGEVVDKVIFLANTPVAGSREKSRGLTACLSHFMGAEMFNNDTGCNNSILWNPFYWLDI